MSGLKLKVVWPVEDDTLVDREALVAAAKDWPRHVEQHRVRVVGAPLMKMHRLDAKQRRKLGATRAVVCVAAVERRAGGR